MLSRAIRAALEVPFAIGDALIQLPGSPLRGEIMPDFPPIGIPPASVTIFTDGSETTD